MYSTLCQCWVRYILQTSGNKIKIANFSSRAAALSINYYDALGIPKNSTQSDIKAAYYELSKQYHPDRNQGCEEASQKFREITQAYEVLGNYQLRKLYDKGIVQTGSGYAHHTASASASATVVEEEDDPATKFYKSRFRKSKVADVTGRTPIYDYDEWSRAHYGYSFQRRKDARQRYDEKESKREKDITSKANEILLFGMVFIGVVVYAGFYSESSYDTPKQVVISNNHLNENYEANTPKK